MKIITKNFALFNLEECQNLGFYLAGICENDLAENE